MVEDVERFANYDVYFSPSVYSESRRLPENATLAHAVWCDADTADPSVFRLQPSYVVESSPNRWQTYWVLNEPIRAAQASLIAKRIAYAHRDQGADISSWPSNKLMRVPATMNTKYDWPHEVIAEDPPGIIYSEDDLLQAYSDVAIEDEKPRMRSGNATSQPPAELGDLPNFFDAQQKLPADFPLDLITSEPPDGVRSEMRWRLIAELVEAGLTDEETAAIAWEAKCSEKWHDDSRGMDGLWAEIAKERQRYELGLVNPPEEPERPKPKVIDRRPKPVQILTPKERERAREAYKRSWLQEYEDWCREYQKIYNPRYNLSGALMALSNTVGDLARLVIDGRDIPLNLYTITLGQTTSGKSLSKSFMRKAVKRSYPGEGNPDMGSNTSSQALFEIIHNRPRRCTMLTSDEADAFLTSLQDKTGWMADLMAKITDLYDGLAEPIHRRGQTDGEWTETSFSMYLMGTEVKVSEALTRTMFESGFLARVLWFIGEKMDIDRSLKGVKFSQRRKMDKQDEPLVRWRERFGGIRQHWEFKQVRNDRIQLIYPDNDETAEWFHDKTASIEDGELFDSTEDGQILTAAATRTNVTAAKIAALLALADGRESINKDDFLIALWILEDCLGDMVYMYRKVAASQHSKNLDLLETVIASNATGMHSAEVYRIMSAKGFTKRDVDTLAEELRQQKRIKQQRGAQDFGLVWTSI